MVRDRSEGGLGLGFSVMGTAGRCAGTFHVQGKCQCRGADSRYGTARNRLLDGGLSVILLICSIIVRLILA
jgi:hypothetical protein